MANQRGGTARNKGGGSGKGSGSASSAGALLGKVVLYPLAVIGAAQLGWLGYQAYQHQDNTRTGRAVTRRAAGEEPGEPSSRRAARRSERVEEADRERSAAPARDASEMPPAAGSVISASARRRERRTRREEETPPATVQPAPGEPAPVAMPAGPGGTAEMAPKGTPPSQEDLPVSSPILPAPGSAPTGARSAVPTPTTTDSPSPRQDALRAAARKPGTRVASAGALGPAVTPGSPTVSIRPEHPRPVPAVEVGRGISKRRQVALTFDAGADFRPTKKILDTLAAAGVKCTFFLTGEWVERNPRTAKRIAAEGHEIGNHSWNHPAFTKLGTSEIQEQLDKTEELIVATTGQSSRPYFRPPLGDRDERVRRIVGEEGYMTIYWTLDSWDSVRKRITADEIRDRVLGNVQPGSIVLMHCGSQPSAEALTEILDGLKERNLAPVTIGQLLEQ